MSQKLSIIDYAGLTNKNNNNAGNILIISKNSSNNSKNNESFITLKKGEKKVQISLGKDKISLNNNNIKNKILQLKKNMTKLSKRKNEINKDKEERLNTTDRLKVEKEEVLIFQRNSYELEDDKFKDTKDNKENILVINKSQKEDNGKLMLKTNKKIKKNLNKNDKKIIKIKPRIKELIKSNDNSKFNSNSLSKRFEKENNKKQSINDKELIKSENNSINDKNIEENNIFSDNININKKKKIKIKIENITDPNIYEENNNNITDNNNDNINNINENEKTIEYEDNNIEEDEKSNRTKAEAMDIVNIIEEENMANINSNFYTFQSTIQTNKSKQLIVDTIQKNTINTINNSSNNNITDTISTFRKNEIISSTQEGTISRQNEPLSTLFKDNNSLVPININIKRKNRFKKLVNVNSQNINLLNQLGINSNKKKSLNKNKKAISIRDLHSEYDNCQLCGRKCPKVKLYSAECEKHLICKKCFKLYYDDIIKKGETEMLCPFIQCKAQMDFYTIKSLISNENLKILYENAINNRNKNHSYDNTKTLGDFSSSRNNDNLKLYSRKNILDINKKSYKNIFINFKSSKELICPFCYEQNIFSRAGGHYMKCLNCGYAICKYCGKEYKENHMEIYDENHCKIYYRKFIIPIQKSKNFMKIFLQLIYILASFFIIFAGVFFYIFNFMKYIFKPNRKNTFINCFKISVIWFMTIIFYMIIFPFIFIFIPYIPLIITACEIFNI